MGRRKNNPFLVDELIDGLWTMDDDEFNEKFDSLSSSDQSKVSNAIYNMENELLGDDETPEGCDACGGPYPHCKTSCPIFDD